MTELEFNLFILKTAVHHLDTIARKKLYRDPKAKSILMKVNSSFSVQKYIQKNIHTYEKIDLDTDQSSEISIEDPNFLTHFLDGCINLSNSPDENLFNTACLSGFGEFFISFNKIEKYSDLKHNQKQTLVAFKKYLFYILLLVRCERKQKKYEKIILNIIGHTCYFLKNMNEPNFVLGKVGESHRECIRLFYHIIVNNTGLKPIKKFFDFNVNKEKFSARKILENFHKYLYNYKLIKPYQISLFKSHKKYSQLINQLNNLEFSSKKNETLINDLLWHISEFLPFKDYYKFIHVLLLDKRHDSDTHKKKVLNRFEGLSIENNSSKFKLEWKNDQAHKADIYFNQFSPCGDYLLTASDDNILILWQAWSGKKIWNKKLEARINLVKFIQKSHFVLVFLDDGHINLWNVETGTLDSTLIIQLPLTDGTKRAIPINFIRVNKNESQNNITKLQFFSSKYNVYGDLVIQYNRMVRHQVRVLDTTDSLIKDFFYVNSICIVHSDYSVLYLENIETNQHVTFEKADYCLSPCDQYLCVLSISEIDATAELIIYNTQNGHMLYREEVVKGPSDLHSIAFINRRELVIVKRNYDLVKINFNALISNKNLVFKKIDSTNTCYYRTLMLATKNEIPSCTLMCDYEGSSLSIKNYSTISSSG